MRKIRNQQEYLTIIDAALDDLFDLESAIEYDEEFMENSLQFIPPIKNELQQLKQKIIEQKYDLSFQQHVALSYMKVVQTVPMQLLPMRELLKQVNHTHIHGFDPED